MTERIQRHTFAQEKPSDLWVPILHKACAKAAGSYHNLSAMSVPEIVSMLTGRSCERFDVGPDGWVGATWEKLNLLLDDDCILLVERSADQMDSNLTFGADNGSMTFWHTIADLHTRENNHMVAIIPFLTYVASLCGIAS